MKFEGLISIFFIKKKHMHMIVDEFMECSGGGRKARVLEPLFLKIIH
jgi:hypothetical protein